MDKTLKYLTAVFLLLLPLNRTIASPKFPNNPPESPNIFKGETHRVSPFSITQPQDSILQQQYQTVQQLFKRKEYSEALKLALPLLTSAQKKDDLLLVYKYTFLIGDIFRMVNNHTKAIVYYKNALSILQKNNKAFDKKLLFEKSGKDKDLANNLLQIGSEFLRINKKDSATIYLKKTVDIQSLKINIDDIKGKAYSNLSGIYIKDSLYAKAKIYALKAVEIYKKNNDKITEAAALGNLANIHLIEKNYNEAKNIYSKALDLLENDSTSLAVKYKENLYYNYAYALYLLKDYTAYNFQEKSYIIKDSLRDKEMRSIVEQVNADYNLNLKKSEIRLKQLEQEKTSLYLVGVITLLLLAFGFIVYNYRLRQKNLKLQLNQTKLARQNEVEKLKSESQIRILNAAIDGKESERKQIAETLHDSVSSLLSSANLHLQASQKQFNGNTPVEVEKSQKIILEASQKIRDLSHTLVSSVLLKFGLKFAITEMAEKYSNSQLKITVDARKIQRYQQNFEIKINNIIQELVNNILKHSQASQANIKIEEKAEQLYVYISDNGCGFDVKKAINNGGLGINQIQARVQMLQGKFSVYSADKEGTNIEIIIPVSDYQLA